MRHKMGLLTIHGNRDNLLNNVTRYFHGYLFCRVIYLVAMARTNRWSDSKMNGSFLVRGIKETYRRLIKG